MIKLKLPYVCNKVEVKYKKWGNMTLKVCSIQKYTILGQLCENIINKNTSIQDFVHPILSSMFVYTNTKESIIDTPMKMIQ